MSILNWQVGRQGTGYEKIKLIESKRFKFDAYLLKYQKGSFIPRHTDPAPVGFNHYRLNIVLKKAAQGGYFYSWHKHLWHWPHDRVIFFRPDITPHMVASVTKGTRYVLSIGWLRRQK